MGYSIRHFETIRDTEAPCQAEAEEQAKKEKMTQMLQEAQRGTNTVLQHIPLADFRFLNHIFNTKDMIFTEFQNLMQRVFSGLALLSSISWYV